MAMTFLPAIDRGRLAAIIGIVRQLVFYVPIMIISPKMIGILGIYYGTFVIDVVIVMGTIIMVKKEFNALRSKQEY